MSSEQSFPLSPCERGHTELAQMSPENRDLVLWCVRNYPLLTIDKAIEILRAFGGL